jgi:hypothetical protein
MAATTAVDAAQPSEHAEPHDASRKRAWWRVKIPSAVIVTLVGIALSAWLLPAFTRQWDDRQKANELRVSLVTDIGAASANAIGDGEQFRATGNHALQQQAVRAWSVASLELESHLRAYFPNPHRLLVKWKFFSYAVNRYLGQRASDDLGDGNLVDIGSGYSVDDWLRYGLPETTLRDSVGVTEVMGALLDIDRSSPRRFLSSYERSLLRDSFHNMNSAHVTARRMNPGAAYRELGTALNELDSGIINDILRSHPAGYSTTKRDLINDLLPF